MVTLYLDIATAQGTPNVLYRYYIIDIMITSIFVKGAISIKILCFFAADKYKMAKKIRTKPQLTVAEKHATNVRKRKYSY
jgi:hypothetical protein